MHVCTTTTVMQKTTLVYSLWSLICLQHTPCTEKMSPAFFSGHLSVRHPIKAFYSWWNEAIRQSTSARAEKRLLMPTRTPCPYRLSTSLSCSYKPSLTSTSAHANMQRAGAHPCALVNHNALTLQSLDDNRKRVPTVCMKALYDKW